MDETTFGALALALMVLGGLYTWWAFRNRGAAAGLRGAAITLLPAAAWATGTLRMFTRIVDAVVDWATSLVFSPQTWAGIGLAGLAVVLYVVAGFVDSRGSRRSGGSAAESPPGVARARRDRAPKQLPSAGGARSEPALDDDLAEIEALLKKRGIT